MLYLNMADAIARVKERVASESKNDDSYIEELLDTSYGLHKTTGELCYRPFWVAAKILEQSLDRQELESDDSTKFTGFKIPIKSLLELQANLDMELDVRPGFGFRGSINSGNLENTYKMAIVLLRQYMPRGYL